MKKILLFLVLCFISIFGMAQTDVTKFLGIPVDGSKSEMIRKLKTKGFKQSPDVADVLIGKFNGTDVNVYIVTNNNKVCRIAVYDKIANNETDIRIRFNVLCEQFKNNSKYCSLSEEDPRIKEDENISYEMSVHNKRYEAIFYQRLDTTTANCKEEIIEEIQSLIYSKYTKEQIENPSEEILQDLYKMKTNYALYKGTRKPVWFMISSDHYGEYYIKMFYDNEYNRAQGEDL